MNNGLPDNLTKFLTVNAKGFVDNDIATTQITLGPNGSYVVKDKKKMQWCGIPEPLAARLRTSKTAGTKLVTLGVDGSYVVVNTNGSGQRHLAGSYARLEEILANMKHFGDIHVSCTSHIQAFSISIITQQSSSPHYHPIMH